jgi:hypothetical protein
MQISRTQAEQRSTVSQKSAKSKELKQVYYTQMTCTLHTAHYRCIASVSCMCMIQPIVSYTALHAVGFIAGVLNHVFAAVLAIIDWLQVSDSLTTLRHTIQQQVN